MAHWQKTVHGYSGIRPALHEQLYDQLKGFPSEDSVRHLAQLGVTYVIVHSSWFPPEERPGRRTSAGVRIVVEAGIHGRGFARLLHSLASQKRSPDVASDTRGRDPHETGG